MLTKNLQFELDDDVDFSTCSPEYMIVSILQLQYDGAVDVST